MSTTTSPLPPRSLASRVLRPVVGVLILLHGVIHLLGTAAAFGDPGRAPLAEPVGPAMGVLWFLAAGLVVVAGAGLLVGRRRWWLVGAPAVVLSQVVVLTDWDQARAGTIMNALLLVAVVHGWRAEGSTSMRERYRRGVARTLAERPPEEAAHPVVTEDDLVDLPPLVAGYLRRTGSVGRPRVTWFRARLHGRIRASAQSPWMTFTGEQVNTSSPEVSRRFWLDASRAGLPIDVLHVLEHGAATMRAAVCSVVPVARGAGPEMDRSETVTLFNDLCFLAPAALLDAPVTWQAIDDHRVLGTYVHGSHSVRAELVFDDDGDLVGFTSDDRLRAGPAGSYQQQHWSTPFAGYRTLHGRRVAATGSAWWHAPEGAFAYIEMTIDDLVTGPAAPLPVRDQRTGISM